FNGGTLFIATNAQAGADINFILEDVAGNTFNNNGFSMNFKGNFSGAGGITFKGKGITTLSGVNTYLGITAVD
ncbi:hypothetical protein N9A81_03545, partial [Synechococcus sp. AH-707-M23]|nr:hypothetical protein [Synechococcus sp. AH-707-M23]